MQERVPRFGHPFPFSAQFFVEHKDMDRQEEDQCDGNHPVENQHQGDMVQNHAEQPGGKGNQRQAQQQLTTRHE